MKINFLQFVTIMKFCYEKKTAEAHILELCRKIERKDYLQNSQKCLHKNLQEAYVRTIWMNDNNLSLIPETTP